MSFDNQDRDNAKIWKRIWRLKVPERIRTFIQLLNHDRVLTKAYLHRLTNLDLWCDECNKVEEDVQNVLRDCPMVRFVWQQLVSKHLQGVFFACNLQERNGGNLSSRLSTDGQKLMKETQATACHQLQHWIKKRNHDESFVMPTNFARMIHNGFREYGDSERFQKKYLFESISGEEYILVPISSQLVV